MDFQKYFEVIDNLARFVAADPRLAEFLPGLAEFREQSRLVAQGGKDVAAISPSDKRLVIPDRATAEAMLSRINELPFCEPDQESPESLRIFGRLSMNLVSTVFHAIREGFPELVSQPSPTNGGPAE